MYLHSAVSFSRINLTDKAILYYLRGVARLNGILVEKRSRFLRRLPVLSEADERLAVIGDAVDGEAPTTDLGIRAERSIHRYPSSKVVRSIMHYVKIN